MKLRWCRKCGRETIQAKKKRWDCTKSNGWFYYEIYIKGWYCPQCGSFLVTKQVEEAR